MNLTIAEPSVVSEGGTPSPSGKKERRRKSQRNREKHMRLRSAGP